MGGELGVDKCPDGYEKITDPGECEEGAGGTGYTYQGEKNVLGKPMSLCNYCGGCKPDTVRVDHTHGKKAIWICKKAGVPTPGKGKGGKGPEPPSLPPAPAPEKKKGGGKKKKGGGFDFFKPSTW